jgi:NAD(P)-dependent dehydrogenase (short-subunit alcohol dehydrogenase family)
MATIDELLNLKHRRVLITGAAGGLGSVMAETLAELGASLVLVDRPGVSLEVIAGQISEKWGADVEHIYCDLESQDQRRNLIAKINKSGRGLNVLINNAAFVGSSDLQGWAEPFEKQTIEAWRRALEVNLTAVFELCQGLAPLLTEAVGGNIINIASIYGVYGPDWRLYEGTAMSNPAAYGASKGGLVQLTRWLSTTLAPCVRVNSISPGGIKRGQPEDFIARYEARTPLGRMATNEDFRGTVAYLASDLSGYLTGQNLSVDGGWGVW